MKMCEQRHDFKKGQICPYSSPYDRSLMKRKILKFFHFMFKLTMFLIKYVTLNFNWYS